MFTKVEKFISYRNLKPKKKEGFLKVISAFSFLGIMLGVAILIIVMSVMNGFRADLTNKILGLNPHIIIEPNANNIDKEFRKKIENRYKNFTFTETFSGEGIVLSEDKAKGIFIKGVELTNLKKIISEEIIVKGSYKNFKEGTVFIGGELAFNNNLKIGDKINLMSSSFISSPIGMVPIQETFKVSGIFNSGFYEFDQNLVLIPISDSLSIFNKDQEDLNIELYIENPLQADKFKKEIQNIDKNLFVYSWNDLNKSFFNALKIERNVMFIILTLIIIVAAFNIISGLTILIKNKTKEIAILKTLGMSDKSIKKSFFYTGFIIGLLATFSGVVIGIIFSFYIEQIRIFLSLIFDLNIFPPEVYFLDKMPSEINFFSIMIIFIFSLIITSLASYFPARSISKMQTTKALKYE